MAGELFARRVGSDPVGTLDSRRLIRAPPIYSLLNGPLRRAFLLRFLQPPGIGVCNQGDRKNN
jgi:hypothetical protein